jgi:hypothetical protein
MLVPEAVCHSIKKTWLEKDVAICYVPPAPDSPRGSPARAMYCTDTPYECRMLGARLTFQLREEGSRAEIP